MPDWLPGFLIALLVPIIAGILKLREMRLKRKFDKEDKAHDKDAEAEKNLNASIEALSTSFAELMEKLNFVSDVAARLNRESLMFRMDRHISAQWISMDDKALCIELHEDHKKLGFNGKCDTRMEAIKALPNIPPKKSDDEDVEYNRRLSDEYTPPAPPPLPSPRFDNPNMRTKLKILVVDDNVSDLTAVTHVLKDEYKITTVKSPEDLVRRLPDLHVDLILLDYVLSDDLTGLDMIPEIRKYPRLKEIPIIMLTGKADSKAFTEALEHGAIDYITMPYDFGKLKRTVEKHI